MKRLIVLLPALLLVGVASVAMAGDYHKSTTLICSDCHTAHYSMQHGYTSGGIYTPLGTGGPFGRLLRNTEVNLCLSCHDGIAWAPDVFGDNITGTARQAGGLNVAAGHPPLTNPAGYDEIDGHTLFSTATPPGGTGSLYVPSTDGLVCTTCHSVHGNVAYRNLRFRTSAGLFFGDTITYVSGANDLTADVWERGGPASYGPADVDFNEPDPTNSAYGAWCQNCHVLFHGLETDANMNNGTDFIRHPTAGANLTGSSLTQYAAYTNRLKMMDSQGLWTGAPTDNTLTPSCFTCHKAHGNANGFGLIYMKGTGTVTDEGDGGTFREMCRQCHRQGA